VCLLQGPVDLIPDSGFARLLILAGHAGGQHMAALEVACQMAGEILA